MTLTKKELKVIDDASKAMKEATETMVRYERLLKLLKEFFATNMTKEELSRKVAEFI